MAKTFYSLWHNGTMAQKGNRFPLSKCIKTRILLWATLDDGNKLVDYTPIV